MTWGQGSPHPPIPSPPPLLVNYLMTAPVFVTGVVFCWLRLPTPYSLLPGSTDNMSVPRNLI